MRRQRVAPIMYNIRNNPQLYGYNPEYRQYIQNMRQRRADDMYWRRHVRLNLGGGNFYNMPYRYPDNGACGAA